MWLAGWLVLFSLRFQTYWDWTELRKFAWPPLPSLPPSLLLPATRYLSAG